MQQIGSDGCGNRNTILFGRVLSLASLDAIMQIQENPGVQRGIKIKLFDHQLIEMCTRTPMDTVECVAVDIVTNGLRVRCRLQSAARAASTSSQTAREERETTNSYHVWQNKHIARPTQGHASAEGTKGIAAA